MLRGLVNPFSKLIDWQTATERWEFLKPIDASTLLRFQNLGFVQAMRIDADLLKFPSCRDIRTRITGRGFILKPIRPYMSLGSATMVFEGHAEIRYGDLHIVGTYRLPKFVKAFQILWSGGVALCILASLVAIIAIPQGAKVTDGADNFISGSLMVISFSAFGVFMLLFARGIGVATRSLNHPARLKLQSFLRAISIEE